MHGRETPAGRCGRWTEGGAGGGNAGRTPLRSFIGFASLKAEPEAAHRWP